MIAVHVPRFRSEYVWLRRVGAMVGHVQELDICRRAFEHAEQIGQVAVSTLDSGQRRPGFLWGVCDSVEC